MYRKFLFLFIILLSVSVHAETQPQSLSTQYKQVKLYKKPPLNPPAKTSPLSQTPAAKSATKAASSSKQKIIPTAAKGYFIGPHGDIIMTKPEYPGTYSKTPLISGRKPVIVIDPGHGGKDPGTRGELGTNEKDLTLIYALALKAELEKTNKYKVVLTRTKDIFVPLPERVNIARKAGGDVMISIHADSNPNKTTRGFSVYTLSDKRANYEAKKLLEKSHNEEVIRGAKLKGETDDVKEALINFAQSSSMDVSHDFAETLGKYLGKSIKPLEKNQREASLAVLTGADIPSVLIELGYLSNNDEERLLKLPDHRQKIVTSISAAIAEYFSKFKMVF